MLVGVPTRGSDVAMFVSRNDKKPPAHVACGKPLTRQAYMGLRDFTESTTLCGQKLNKTGPLAKSAGYKRAIARSRIPTTMPLMHLTRMGQVTSPPQHLRPLNEQRGDIVTSHISTHVAFPGSKFLLYICCSSNVGFCYLFSTKCSSQ